MGKGSIAVVGGGLAGLMATLKIVEAGLSVDLFSLPSSARIPPVRKGA